MKRFVVLLLMFGGIGSALWAQDETAQSSTVRLKFDLADLRGQSAGLDQNDARQIRAFVFLSTTCPVSNSYTATLNRVAETLPGNVRLYGVVSDPYATHLECTQHFEQYRVTFPVLFDASGLLAEQLRPTHVPEAFVLDGDSRVVYRGAIDNAYESIGRRRASVEHHYLHDAIQAAVLGRKIATSQTDPVGCIFPTKKSATGTAVTYNRDIAPLINRRCLNCHRPGQVAPIMLTDYREAVAHADMLVEVTQRRIMPPWIPGSETSHRFVGERRLSDRELELLRTWAGNGCPEGDPADLPPAPEFAEGWQLGVPDMVVRMPDRFTVPADGPDILQNFVIPLELTEDRMVAAVEFHPGNRRVVHHAVLFLDDKQQARALDAKTPEPGYANFGGPGFLPSGALGGWSVGNTARRLPDNMGRYLKRGSDLVVQVHYHPSGKEEADQSELGIYFVDKPVSELLTQPGKLVGSIWMANYEMDIAPGDSGYRRSTEYTLPRDVTMVGVVPHMHLLGKAMKVTARRPGGEPEVLVDIPAWNYNWQDEYYYERPFSLPSGTVLKVESVFDNSAENPSNPSSPPKRVTWGDETTDEMLFCFFLLTADRTEDLIHTIFDNLGHDLKQPRREVGESR
ncbi:MAG: redoxin domain-containing protein [Planctomycetaceae bacterium]|nr:redoxin domain-containing protein [Planctomycetaceae bacterium]